MSKNHSVTKRNRRPVKKGRGKKEAARVAKNMASIKFRQSFEESVEKNHDLLSRLDDGEVGMFDELKVVRFDEHGQYVPQTYAEKYPEGRETEQDLALNRIFN